MLEYAIVSKERLIDKIRKLRRKAEGTDNEHEAAAFAAAADRLIRESGVLEEELRETDPDSWAQRISERRWRGWPDKRFRQWQGDLASYLARNCGVAFFWTDGRPTAYGPPGMTEVWLEQYEFLHDQIERLLALQFLDATESHSAGLGMVATVISKIEQSKTYAASGARALVAQTHEQARKKAESVFNLRTTRVAHLNTDGNLYHTGVHLGRTVQIRRETE